MQSNSGNSTISSTQRKILVLGTGIMQVPVIYQAKLLSLYVIGVDANPNSVGASQCDCFWHIDLKDYTEIINRIQKEQINLSAVLTCATDFSYSVACIAEACNLPGISKRSAEIVNYKDIMRQCLEKHKVSIPQYLVCSAPSSDDSLPVDDWLNDINDCFPKDMDIVVKPVDNMGARGVQLITSKDRYNNPEKCMTYLSEAHAYSRKGNIIAEEKLTDIELSIDSFMQNSKLHPLGIADRHIHCEPYFIETGHSIPSQINIETQKSACKLLEQAALAAGINNGICKGDVIFHNGVPYIGEFAARLSGGYMSGWTIPYSYGMYQGMSPSHIAIQLALGIEIPFTDEDPIESFFITQLSKNTMHCTDRALHAMPGILENIIIDEPLYTHPFFKNAFIRPHIGDGCKFPKNNAQKIGSLVSSAKNAEQAHKIGSKLLCNITFCVASNQEANDFIAGEYTSSTWRDYENDEIECSHRALLFNYIGEDTALSYLQKEALPVFFPKRLQDDNSKGTWSHCSIKELLQILEEKKLIKIVQDEMLSVGGFFWSALLRGGWQGFQYFLRMTKDELKGYV